MIIDKILSQIANTPLNKMLWSAHQKLFPFPADWFQAEKEIANELLYARLRSPNPCLIGRLGKTETEAVMAYLFQGKKLSAGERTLRFLSNDLRYLGWKHIGPKICELSGVFPPEPALLDQFSKCYLESMSQLDVIGSWLHAEMLLQEHLLNIQRIPLNDLEPYLSPTPWSRALRGQRVLVIHPFEASIRKQYAQREKLFSNPDVLPEFELLTLKAVQSLGGQSQPSFDSWFDALKTMQEQIKSFDFDIALIGAGAYGLPLGAFIKGLGKKAVHLGGATQMLFGIYGERWVNDPLRKQLINEHWVRPADSEKPASAKNVENSCYW